MVKNESNDKPRAVFVLGGVAAGKTWYRRTHLTEGLVPIDAADIFIQQLGGAGMDFPGDLAADLEAVGTWLTVDTLLARKPFAIEMIGDDSAQTTAVFEAVRALGYDIVLHGIDCTPEVAQQRHETRDDDNISAYFTQPIHQRWLLDAARNITAGHGQTWLMCLLGIALAARGRVDVRLKGIGAIQTRGSC